MTRAPTYADSRLTVPNKNPVILDSRGEARVFSASTHYFVIKDYTDATTLHTQDNVAFERNPIIPLTDDAGADLSSGLLGTYTSGSSTGRTTFADPDELVTNANPVVADAEGIARVYSGVGQNIKYTLKDSRERLIWTLDDVPIGNRLQYLGDNGGNLHIAGGYSYVKSLAGGTEYFYPNASSDDGFYSPSEAQWNSDWVYMPFGRNYASSAYHIFVRFNNVTIPRGSTITLARVTFQNYGGFGTETVNANLYFENADNPSAPTDGADFMARSKTAAFAWDNVDIPVPDYDGYYTTPDISSILQTVVNRPGFSNGNSVIFYAYDNVSAANGYRLPRTIDAVLQGYSGNYPKLYVEWA